MYVDIYVYMYVCMYMVITKIFSSFILNFWFLIIKHFEMTRFKISLSQFSLLGICITYTKLFYKLFYSNFSIFTILKEIAVNIIMQ